MRRAYARRAYVGYACAAPSLKLSATANVASALR